MTFTHPNPAQHRLTQYILGGALLLTALSVPLQVTLGILITGGQLFILTALVSLLLSLPLLMGVSVYPAVTLSPEGITLHPVIWRRRFVAWGAVTAVKPYPLLPTEEMEANRKKFVGRKRYRAPEGVMLVIPALPLQYRAAGFFAGEGFTGVVAVTTRTHTDYDTLVQELQRYTEGNVLL